MQHPDNDAGANFRLNDSTINSSRDTNVHITHNQLLSKDAMTILQEHAAFGALFDSKERFDPPKCHPDTRKAVLDAINRWAQDQEGDSKPIMWLRGAAGAGKSAIAQTSAEGWEELKILAASFFFSRTAAGRNESSRLIPTLAYQLSLSAPSSWPHMKAALLRDVGLFERSLKTQLTELIIRPLAAAAAKGDFGCHVVIIDGLDECCIDLPGQEHEAQQKDIIDAITAYAKQANCPLRFLIASRPERQIRASFSRRPLSDLSRTIVLDETQNPNADIELYLECRIGEIKHNHPYLGSSWPPEGTISLLLQKSSGHFIYAATATRYLERPRQDPRIALEAILNIGDLDINSDSPFAELDALYLLIMRSVQPSSLATVLKIFELMGFNESFRPKILQDSQWFPFTGLPYSSPNSLEQHLFLPSGSVYLHLVDLHSILDVPLDGHTPIRFMHASFSEFLSNQIRSGPFYIDWIEAFSQLQPIRLKHLLIQSLHKGFGRELQPGYEPDCLAIELVWGLEPEHAQFPPPAGFPEGLAALIGKDDEVFASYIRSVGLDKYGVERNVEQLEKYLFTIRGIWDTDGIGTIITYLKRCGIENIRPLSTTQGLNPVPFNKHDDQSRSTGEQSEEPSIEAGTPAGPRREESKDQVTETKDDDAQVSFASPNRREATGLSSTTQSSAPSMGWRRGYKQRLSQLRGKILDTKIWR